MTDALRTTTPEDFLNVLADGLATLQADGIDSTLAARLATRIDGIIDALEGVTEMAALERRVAALEGADHA